LLKINIERSTKHRRILLGVWTTDRTHSRYLFKKSSGFSRVEKNSHNFQTIFLFNINKIEAYKTANLP